MPYNPSVSDRRGDYMMMGAQALGAGINQAADSIGGAMMKFGEIRQERERMGGMLEQIGAFQDPKFAEDFAKAPYGKQQALFAKGMMDYMKQQEIADEMRKMQRQQEMMRFQEGLRESANAVPQEELPTVAGMAEDYMTATSLGGQMTPDFFGKLTRLSSKAQKGFFGMVGNAMELFKMQQPAQQVQAPQYLPAPDGGYALFNPNTGAAQHVAGKKQGTMQYGTMPAPAPGTVGVLQDPGGGVRVIQPPGTAPLDGLPPGGLLEDTGEEAQRRLNSMESLFGE